MVYIDARIPEDLHQTLCSRAEELEMPLREVIVRAIRSGVRRVGRGNSPYRAVTCKCGHHFKSRVAKPRCSNCGAWIKDEEQ